MTPATIGELLAGRAGTAGENVALDGDAGRLTYAALWAAISHRAAEVANQGLDDRPVMLLDTGSGADQIVEFGALAATGRTALLVDPAAPDDLRRRWRETAGVGAELGTQGRRPLVEVDRRSDDGTSLLPDGASSTTAFVATGFGPPGDLRWTSHRDALRQAAADVQQLELTREDRVGCLLPLSAETGRRTLLAAWHVGAAAVVFDPTQGWAGLRSWLTEHHVTVAVMTPTLRSVAELSGADPASLDRQDATIVVLDQPLPAGSPVDDVAPTAAPDPDPTPLADTPEVTGDETGSDPDADPVAAALGEIWGTLLGTDPVPRDRDLFELGAYSLLAARSLVLLEQRTTIRLPMAVFLDTTTIDGLTAAAHQVSGGETNGPADDPTVVCIQSGDPGRPPLFVTHDLQGSAWRFRPLAEAVGGDQPVYGFESPMLEGRLDHPTIEALATFYVEAMQGVRPTGPYRLCGYSFGGILAFEMARLLRGTGQEVEVLGVIDVGPGYRGLDYSRRSLPPLPYLHDAVARSDGRLPRWAAPIRRLWLNQRVLARGWRRTLASGDAVAPDQRLWFAWWAHWNLVGPRWSASDYDGRVDLFWADTTRVVDATDPTMGWGEHATEVVVHRVPGRHESLMAPPTVDVIGAALRSLLDDRPTPEILVTEHP